MVGINKELIINELIFFTSFSAYTSNGGTIFVFMYLKIKLTISKTRNATIKMVSFFVSFINKFRFNLIFFFILNYIIKIKELLLK